MANEYIQLQIMPPQSISMPNSIDELVKSQKCPRIVIPVKTGIQRF